MEAIAQSGMVVLERSCCAVSKRMREMRRWGTAPSAVAEVAQGPLLDVQLLADGGDGDGCKVFADIVLGAQQRFGNRSALAHVLPQKHQRREKQALGDIPAPLLGADEAVLKQALDEIARADAKHAVLLQAGLGLA